ncbi:hypothetical protein M501DRAFT_28089 [Patellaria atrata CBS 101060]|uniref:Meiotically up-regulated gene 190 protein n=1 Tax=Patellaria atrata CBS 101060 TaxID=1346257 RepID=A0A9P4SJN5_9PEZI|nr:hypothetical protein M501DRAFT_28089 [Patellaria atrata CBS 101060]
MSGRDDADAPRRNYKAPYTPHHPIPTISKYREEKEQRKVDTSAGDASFGEEHDPSRTHSSPKDTWKQIRHGEKPSSGGPESQPYSSTNKNIGNETPENGRDDEEQLQKEEPDESRVSDNDDDDSNIAEDTSQVNVSGGDPKQQRKQMKKKRADHAEREVTDPVTHLPVQIHDFTDKDLKSAPENDPPSGTQPQTASGQRAKGKDEEQIERERGEGQETHSGMEVLFPPPEYSSAREELASIYKKALTFGLTAILGVLALIILLAKITATELTLTFTLMLLAGTGFGGGLIWATQGWVEKKAGEIWDVGVWQAEKEQGKKKADSRVAESTQWLNSLMGAIWPLVNPDLFISVADMLEVLLFPLQVKSIYTNKNVQDVMQASLPKMIRMVSVEDIGQGSESLRILGVRWLPTGAAAQSVSEDGKLKSGKDSKQQSDRTVPNQGEVQKEKDESVEGDDEGQSVAEGMEAEEGDFVNVEIAFAYKASSRGKTLKTRSKNAHLFLAFYLPANVKLPVWVELRGIIGTIRLRLQLTPDPPFFSLCTLTFLGQPKVDLACVPLTQKGLNIMDLPLISNFVQSSVDAAMAEYVAPKSLTLDLKDMLVGEDFKKDTLARGVLVVHIKHAYDFKEGDAGFLLKKGSADPYVSVGWAKFGKPVWSTRVIQGQMNPSWEETAFILVTPNELNVDERLRVQIWDSDRTSADDDLGRIEIDLKQIMRDSNSNGKMWDREDGFKALQAGEGMPGKLEWSVGYFSKKRILDSQLAEQTEDPDVKNEEQLRQKVYQESEHKLREAMKDENADEEIEQQKKQDFKARQDELVITSRPPDDFPSGILSIQIHQITGLELEAINKNKEKGKENASDEEEEGNDLPSAYCDIILNHQKIFKTRTKPKNSKPFFNAGCERVIKDWRTAEIMISVRDSRIHENDPLLGIVVLPLRKLFSHRAQVNGFFPLAGGIGYGRIRISMVFRSIQLQAPRNLLGWSYGTLEIQPEIKSKDLPSDLLNLRMKAWTSLGKGRFNGDKQGTWTAKKDRSVKLAVRKRYSSPLVIELRRDSALKDSTPAFAVLWLKDVVDEEEMTLTLPVWKGDIKRASACALENMGEKIGTIELKLRFWSGLSGYHHKLASKDKHIADVMEVLDTANDNDDVDWDVGEGEGDRNDSSSSSDSEDSSDDGRDGELTPTTTRSEASSSDRELAESGKRGPIDQIKEYKNHRKQLHRRNRGLMQWKGPRTVNWMKEKMDRANQSVTGLFHHHERDPGIETEV